MGLFREKITGFIQEKREEKEFFKKELTKARTSAKAKAKLKRKSDFVQEAKERAGFEALPAKEKLRQAGKAFGTGAKKGFSLISKANVGARRINTKLEKASKKFEKLNKGQGGLIDSSLRQSGSVVDSLRK